MKKFTLFFIMLCVAVTVAAVPARRTPKSVKQSDGTTLIVQMVGNEAFHYYSTLDGIPLVREANGDYSYATMQNGALVSTNCLAHNEGYRSIEEQTIIDANEFSGMSMEMSKVAATRSTVYNTRSLISQTIRPIGVKNIPVLLVEFSDVKFTFPRDSMSLLFNGENYTGPGNPICPAQGSVRDYFIAQSDSLFIPNFIATPIITLPNNVAYYGKNTANGGHATNAQKMIADACKAIDADFDFSIFDNDGDGEIEFLYCLYAGFSEAEGADENTIWPHMSHLSLLNGAVTLDGVKIDCYCCSSELAYNEDYIEDYGYVLHGIGTCCHEFSHCLGLPDIYDTTSSIESRGFAMDYWDLMDYGNYNADGFVPIGYNAYQRDFMGWRSLEVLTESGNYSMEALTNGGKGYKIVNDANENEYYILENRQKNSWDRYIFNSGMLIIHVDYSSTAWANNQVNINNDHKRFTIIPADNQLLLYYNVSFSEFKNSLRGDTWPGTSGNTALTNESTPAATVFNGDYMNKPITNISEKDGKIFFSFMKAPLSAPIVQEATNIGETSFTANWQAVDGASEYIVTLEKLEQLPDGATLTEPLLQEDFMNCSTGNTAITNADTYFATAGWSVANVYSETGLLRIGSKLSKGELTTPPLNADGTVTLTFNAKLYSAADSGVTLTVYSNDTVVYTAPIDVVSLEAHKATFTAEGDFSLLFTTANSTGQKRVIIDDVNISVSTAVTKNVVASVTTTETHHDFTNLDASGVYRYSVQAVDGWEESPISRYTTVSLATTAIPNIANGTEKIELYSISGTKVYSGNPTTIPSRPKGIYVVRSGNATRKITIK